MQRNTTSTMERRFAGRDAREVIAILGIVLSGIVTALVLPLWLAAPMLLLALGALRVIAVAEPVVEPVVIRRDERR